MVTEAEFLATPESSVVDPDVTDDLESRSLPFAFAKRHGVLLRAGG